MVTAQWKSNAREEIYGFVDYLNTGLSRRNNFDKDFILKTALVLCDLPVQYIARNFNIENLSLIEQRWERIKDAIQRGVELVNGFGIDRDTLTSVNALIPIIYYLYHRPGVTLRKSTQFDATNATRIRRWLTMAMLNNVFGGQSDSLLRDVRQTQQEHASEPDFSLDAINTVVAKSGRVAAFDDIALEGVLDISYGKQGAFLALSLLYDENGWGLQSYHQDHIFPRSLFTKHKLTQYGIPDDEHPRHLALCDRLANLELLQDIENEQRGSQPLEQWLKSRDARFRQRHLIPDDNDLLRLERFPEFIEAREELIRNRLRTLLGTD
jgi:hypothetical protein